MIYEFIGGPNNDFGEHPELLKARKKGVVTLHVIPQHFPGSQILVPLGTIGDHKNVLCLNEAQLKNCRLQQFRLEWFNFWKSPTSPEKIRNNANAIKKKYSDLFSS
jgi:hypothetical protein